jgi:hypothetical protein
MKSLIRLESHKQSKTLLGLLLIVVITLTLVTASVSGFAGLPLGETFLSVTVMLQAIGIPFFGLLLGGSAGAALRGSDRKAEEDIPVRPIKRVFAAYIVSLIYLSILVAILFVASKPMPYSPDVQGQFQVPLIMMMLLPLHSAAFVFSYWLSQGLLGSVVSLIATVGPAYWLFINDYLLLASLENVPQVLISILAIIFFPFWIFGGWEFVLISFIATPAILATVVHLLTLRWLVNRIEREKLTWLPMKVAVAVLLLSALSLGFWGVYFLPNSNYETSYYHHGHMHSCPRSSY